MQIFFKAIGQILSFKPKPKAPYIQGQNTGYSKRFYRVCNGFIVRKSDNKTIDICKF